MTKGAVETRHCLVSTSANKIMKKKYTIAIGKSYWPFWKRYNLWFKKMGHKTILLDLFNPDWAERLTKIKDKVDAYLWHADTNEENYRKIHDRIFFIEKFLKKPVFPDMNMYYTYNDKIKQYEIFKHLKLPFIPTYIAFSREKALQILNKVKKYPVVMKDPYGASGCEVELVKNKQALKKIINKKFPLEYSGEKVQLYLQDFIPNMSGDLRIITVGNKIAAAYWRKNKNDWRHNIYQGAEHDFENIPKHALDFCLKISKQQKFHWMSYDLFILPNKKIKLIEWSCNFGSKAPMKHGIDIRKIILEYIINYLDKN